MHQLNQLLLAGAIPVGSVLLAAFMLFGATVSLTDVQANASENILKMAGSDAKVRARASASSSAGATATQDGTKCRAQSSASAEAQSGDEIASDRDEDSAVSEDGPCRAEAHSSATATSGETKKR